MNENKKTNEFNSTNQETENTNVEIDNSSKQEPKIENQAFSEMGTGFVTKNEPVSPAESNDQEVVENKAEESTDAVPKEKRELPTIEIEKVEAALEKTSSYAPFEVPKETEKPEVSLNQESPKEVPQENIMEPKHKKKHTSMIVIVILAVLLFILGAIYFIFNNSKNLFLSSINKEYGNILNTVQGTFGSTFYKEVKNSSAVTRGNLTFQLNMNESMVAPETALMLKEINKLSGQYTIGMDYKNKILNSTLLVKYDNQNMINANIYGEKNQVYLELKDLFDKYLSVPIEEYDSLFNDPSVTVDDMKYIVTTLKNAFLNSLDAKDFKKSSETISLNGKDEKVSKVMYTLNEKNGSELSSKIFTALKKDDTFIKVIAKYLDKNEEEIKVSFDKIIKEASKEDKTSTDVIHLSVYTRGLLNEAVRYEIETQTKNEYTDVKQTSTISYTKEKNKNVIEMKQNGQTIGTLTMAKVDNDKMQYKLVASTLVLTIDTTIKENNTSSHYVLTEESTGLKATGDIIAQVKKENQKYTGDTSATLSVTMSNTTLLEGNFKMQYTTSIGDKVEKKNVENSISMDAVTEADWNAMMQKLLENPVFMKFMTNMNTVGGTHIQ